MKKPTLLFLLSIISIFFVQAQSNLTRKKISLNDLKDKIAGGWAGKMIGVTYGAPHEFRFQQAINTDTIKWAPADIKGSIWQDDLYVQLSFLMAMDKFGIDAPAKNFQEMLAKAGYPLWCANMQARKNYYDSIFPPASGDPENSFRADDIDFQIEADYIGFMNPGLPQNVVDICGKIGHIMNYGDGVYGGIFVGALYSAAYFENDINKIIEQALHTIPAESDYAKIVRDVIKLHNHYPKNWEAAWKELDDKWGDEDISGAGSKFNIDAKLNGAYIVMGLLYGEGDVYRTLEITTRCGQDADCNPSNAMAVLGVMKGFSALPADMQKGVKDIGDSIFINTSYSFNSAVIATDQYALQLTQKKGAYIKNDTIYIPNQPLKPAAYEVSFPKLVYDRSVPVFSKPDWVFSSNWKTYIEKSWDGKSERDQAIYANKAGDVMEFNFNGTGISLMGNWVKDGGKADVYLDGKFQRRVNTYYNYAAQEHRDVSIWHKFQLSPGKHTVKLVVAGEKHPDSMGANIYLTQAILFKTGDKKSDGYRFTFEK
ncbi:MAG: ADP-ribosylglycohydrolase family protein [Chitinophagaceae bacterium]|nr:MAG: ADP-ribosylglycohydrolase family protein [Chitinophagaceae bacterium]